MKIGVDIDGVIADFVGSFLPLLNKYCECKLEDIINYDFEKNININITQEENKKLWKEIEKNRIFKELKLIKGCQAALKKISKGNTIIQISSRKKKVHIDTVKWLRKNKIPFAKLELVDNIKSKVSKMIGCDIILEDNLEVARMLGAKGKLVLLFVYPWNIISRNVMRVKNWTQAEQQIELYKSRALNR